MPEMGAPRALVFRPLVKGNEALGTRLGRFQNSYRRYKRVTYKLISPERSNHTLFMEKAKVALVPQFGSSHLFESYRQKLPITVAKTELN